MASDDNIYGVDDDCTEFMSLQNQKNHAYWNIEPLKGPDGIVLPFYTMRKANLISNLDLRGLKPFSS